MPVAGASDAHRRPPAWQTRRVLVLPLALHAAAAAAAACPQYPTSTTSSVPPKGPAIQNHWSEVVKLPRPDTSTVTSDNNSRLHCPNLQSNLIAWNNASAWLNGVIPSAANQTDVTIAPGASVLVKQSYLDHTGAIYGRITIPTGSSLVFDDSNITLSTNGIYVNGGNLTIGSPTCRMNSYITISLRGSAPSTMYDKAIVVDNGGILDVHGQVYAPTWTRLAATASANDNVIYVQDLVNWEVGQTIVILTSALKDSRDYHENEQRVITATALAVKVGPRVTQITLDSPLNFNHYAGPAYQVEVALLSRRIVIRGDDMDASLSAGNDICTVTGTLSTYPCSAPNGLGGHIQIIGMGVGRATAIELVNMGQTNVLGRYPYHLHMTGDNGRNSYLNHASIHNSFFRGAVIHGTNNATYTNNVAYDIVGHCYYLEDGVEQFNTLAYNLAAFVHFLGPVTDPTQFSSQTLTTVYQSGDLLVPSDVSASGFYITNAYNYIIGNAASGGWSGFIFPNLPQPVGLHLSMTDFNPSSRPCLVFDGNSAHSTGYWWGSAAAIYVGGLYQVDDTTGLAAYNPGRVVSPSRETCAGALQMAGSCSSSLLLWLSFTNTKAFLANRGIVNWGNRAEVIHFEAHDCGLAANMFGQVFISDMLVICRTDNRVTLYNNACTPSNWWLCSSADLVYWSSFGGFQWYDTSQAHIITNSTFRNCTTESCPPVSRGPQCNATAWELLSHSDQFAPEIMQTTARIRYQNCNTTLLWRFMTRVAVSVSGRMQNWIDADGSTSLKSGPRLIGSNWSNDWYRVSDNCTAAPPGMDMWECPTANVHLASLYIEANSSDTDQVGVTQCGNGPSKGLPCPIDGYIQHLARANMTTGLATTVNPKFTGAFTPDLGSGWYLRYFKGAPSRIKLSNIQINDMSSTLVLALPYPPRTTFNVTGRAETWCLPTSKRICTYRYVQMTSLAGLYARTAGDAYYFDTATNVLFVQVIAMHEDSIGENGVWDRSRPPKRKFSRDGLTLIQSGGYTIDIQASCAANGQYCALPGDDPLQSRTARLFAKPPAPVSSSKASTTTSGPAVLANAVMTSVKASAKTQASAQAAALPMTTHSASVPAAAKVTSASTVKLALEATSTANKSDPRSSIYLLAIVIVMIMLFN